MALWRSKNAKIHLVVGLGNPGEKYAHTRHNVGFMALNEISKLLPPRVVGKQSNGILAKCDGADGQIFLLWPQTFMNESGVCVQAVMRKFGIGNENCLVIYDDIDLPCGRLRIRMGGGAGTHNGMTSVVACLGDQNFPRIRIGVGANQPGTDLAAYVLGKPTPVQRQKLEPAINAAAEAAHLWAQGKPMDQVMNHFNSFSVK